MNQNKPSKNKSASALVAAILTIAILSLLAGVVVSNVNNRRITLSQGSAWQEALVAAEAGAHEGIARVEQDLFANGENGLPAGGIYDLVPLTHDGEGPTSLGARYSLTQKPMQVGKVSQPFYKIVSTGTVGLPGGMSLSMDSRDAVLRKLNLLASTRTATRTVEAWIQPVYLTSGSMGLKVDGEIRGTAFRVTIDSFNTADPKPNQPIRYKEDTINGVTYRVPPDEIGFYNKAPYNILGANIATNSPDFRGGNGGGGLYGFGSLYTGGGTRETITGAGNIQGDLYNDYYEAMPPVYAPTWNVSSGPKVNKSKTFTGGTEASPAQYIVSSIAVSGQAQVTFDVGTTGSNPDPSKKYVEVYVTGDVSTKGNGTQGDGSIKIINGVNVKMYVGGNIDLSGNGLVNDNRGAASFSILGINPTAPLTQEFKLGGSAKFYGTVYAPGATLTLGGGAEFVGSLAGKTASLSGNVQIRYDEALGDEVKKILTSFKVASWFEDTRPEKAKLDPSKRF